MVGDFFRKLLGKPTKNELVQIEWLKNFEKLIADDFKNKLIRHPIHLDDGNELELIKIFRMVSKNDWVCGTWRSHYISLLKGVPEQKLRQAIHKGHSISLCFPEHKIISSAIVGGILPIALGLAYSIRERSQCSTVWCFVGDMSAETGTFHECLKYATNFNLPIKFVINDNNKSVCTDTRKTWGMKTLTYEGLKHPKIIYYKSQSKYPHAGGSNERIQF